MANILIVSSNLKDWNKLGGGSERTATLAEALVGHEVTFLCFAWDATQEVKKINNYIKFIKPGAEPTVIQKHRSRVSKDAKNNHDITKHLYKKYLRNFNSQVHQLSAKADLVILDHFSAAPFIEDIVGTVPIIYNSHNAEIIMANQLHPDDAFINDIIEKMEKLAISGSTAMTYCSQKDFEEMTNHYGFVSKDTTYIPNGTELRERVSSKKRIQSKDIIFVGSAHPPNVLAAKKIIDVAKAMPKYNFLIVGGAGNSLDKNNLPENMSVLGVVNDQALDSLFKNSFAFINPMDSGSGTHLKMMKALSYGIPIITSKTGARGFSNEEIKRSMIIAEKTNDFVEAIVSLSDLKLYDDLCINGFNDANSYNWEDIKTKYLLFVESVIEKNKVEKVIISPSKKQKVLLYSIVRNIESKFDQYAYQIKKIVKTFPEYEFYLSIYENDSNDKTKTMLHSTDWSFLNGVSIVTENINTEFYGSVKDPVRVENLSMARNKAIESGGFLNKVDYVLMVEGDLRFSMVSIKELLNFKDIEPNFDVVSAVSIRKNGTHYDWWATRTTPVYKPNASELDVDFARKHYGEYYSTSNGLVLYRAKPFQEGIRHGWINTVTGEFDCEMVVLCQNFRAKGYKNIYINYKAQTFV
jgi:glycosyltransferase involved in cell wall biosynthesis